MRLRGLVLTNLFATPDQPSRGAFNQRQFAELQKSHDLVVFVPLPRRWPRLMRSANVTVSIVASGSTVIAFPVWHPPIIGRLSNAWWLYRVARATLRRHLPHYRPQFVIGSFAYPDGVAATLLGRSLGVPAIIKAHGSDLNLMAGDPLIRLQLHWAFPRAAGVVTVSRALVDRMRELRLQHPHTLLVYNGIDRTVFRPLDRSTARTRLGIAPSRRCILYIGNLKREKGVFDLLRAFEQLSREAPEVDLEFVGDGPATDELSRSIAAAGLGHRVSLRGARPHDEMPCWLAACDLLCLPSHAEGVPNVLVEAQASGRAVVATAVGGVPEVVGANAGLLVRVGAVDELERALTRALSVRWDPERIAHACPMPSWHESAQRLGDFVASRLQGAL